MLIKEFKFSKTFAKMVGITGAVISQYLAYQTEYHRAHDNGHRWFYFSLDSFVKVYDGLFSRNAIHRNLSKLIKKGILIRKFVPSGKSMVSSYAFSNPHYTSLALATDKEAIYFDPVIAKERGSVIQAVVIHNLAYRIIRTREHTPEHTWQVMSAYNMAEFSGLSRKNLSRAFKSLMDDNIIVTKESKNGTANVYTFVDKVKYLKERAATYKNHQERLQRNLAFVEKMNEKFNRDKMGYDRDKMGCHIVYNIIREDNKTLSAPPSPTPKEQKDFQETIDYLLDQNLTNEEDELPYVYEEA